MPVRLRVDSDRAACTGRSIPDLVPLPSTARGSRDIVACRIAAAIASSSVGASRSLTACRQRKHLVRVEQPIRIERRLDTTLLLKFFGVELNRHQVAFFHADAVLAGEAAAHLHAQLQNVGAEMLRLAKALRIVCIEHDERMEIAVAGM